jgi:hypothetical protein
MNSGFHARMGMKQVALGLVLGAFVVPATAQQPAQDQMDAKTKEIQQLEHQVSDLSARLKQLEDDLAAMKKGAEKPEPKPAPKSATSIGGYAQLQYRASENPGEFDGFGVRRIRINFLNDANERTHLKVSYDFATTQFGAFNEAAESGGQLRDAFITYDLVPKVSKVIFGRQAVPLGYEIERGDPDREVVERSKYNDLFFNNQRSTGLLYRQKLSPNVEGFVGGMNALTFTDPGQRAIQGPTGNRLAVVGGVRYKNGSSELGVSAFAGKRQQQVSADSTIVNPTNDRRFFYVDGKIGGLGDPRLTLRAEAMFGHDRIPQQSAVAGNDVRDVNGGHVQLAFAMNPKNTIALRYEQFDPNTDNSGDLFDGLSLAYLHYLNPNMQFTAAFERFTDESRATNKNYNVSTFRVQYKF